MADTTYNVRVKYQLDKDKAESDANSLARTFDRLAGAVAGAFAVHKIMDFSARLVKLQAQFEEMRIGLATMLTGFGAPGFDRSAKGFESAMRASSGLMRQMLSDAAALPGTAEELMEVTRAAIPGGIASGRAIMGQDSVYEMGKRLMTAAHLLQIPGGSATVAREFQAMMEGRATGRNDLFARIRGMMNDGKGIDPKSFNALTEPERWKEGEQALKKLIDPALPSYAKTWDAIGHTTKNWVEQLVRAATGGMFETLKSHLKGVNDWLEKNRASVEQMLSTVGGEMGDALGKTFELMKDAFVFMVQNRQAIITVAQAMGAVLVGAKMFSGFKGGVAGATFGGAGMGLLMNGLTGGDSLSGILMAVAGALLQFGGVVGLLSAAFIGLQAATNLVTEAMDKQHKINIDRHTEGQRLMPLYKQFETSEGGMSNDMFAIGKQIIQQYKLNSGYMGAISNERFSAYYANMTDLDQSRESVMSARRFLEAVAARMRNEVPYGPNGPNAIEAAMQKLYEKPKVVPEKPKVNVNVVIKQDISMAEDADRILLRTRQAVEDALMRPIESGYNRMSILR